VWGSLWAWFSPSTPASFAVQTYPALIALYFQSEFLTTVLDGHIMLLVYMGNKLNQNLFGFLGDVFALEVTI
jgi:hypothetical protein